MKQRSAGDFPLAIVSILCITGLFTGLQFVFPQLLTALERTPTGLANHEWWRLMTALLVHDGGWRQIAFNFPAILVVGTWMERIYGPWRLLLVYYICGFVGNIAGYVWQPQGAGASVAGAGLLGAVAVWLLRKPIQAKVGGALILLGAGILTWHRDIHGPPLLVGACIGWLLRHREVSHRKI